MYTCDVCSICLLLAAGLAAGLGALWSPGVILSLQLITIIMFFFSGTSTITTGELRFGLAADWRSQAGCEEQGCKGEGKAAA